MPSRRQLLAATMGSSLTGCLSILDNTMDGHLQGKVISLEWSHGQQTYRDEPLWLWFDRDERTISGRYDPTFVGDAVRSPESIVVDEEMHRKLSTRFDVSYVIGMCGEGFDGSNDYGCRNTGIGRSDFNRVQLNDRAVARLRNDRFDIVEVDDAVYSVESIDVHQYDFMKLHEDHGLATDELS